MISVKVFCMTKNEYDLIEDFILYYGYLFGYENVILIDNISTHPAVLEIYKKYIKKGITIYYEDNYQGQNQGYIFTKYMLKYKSTCDFLIGLDTDEFLFSIIDFNNNNEPCNREKILNVFENYKNDDTLFKINSYPSSIVDISNENYINNKMNHPARNIIYFSENISSCENMEVPCNDTPKYFSRSNAFMESSCGNHSVKVSNGKEVNSLLGMFHYNFTGKRRSFERAKEVIEGYKYFSTSLEINTQIDILATNFHNHRPGFHKERIYYKTLLRNFIVNLFIKYIKRLPNREELNYHVENNLLKISHEIENNFINCDEAINQTNVNDITFDDNHVNDLIYGDDKIDEVSRKYKVFTNVHLQKLLNEITNI